MATFYRMSDGKCAMVGRKVVTVGQINRAGCPMFEGFEWTIEGIFHDESGDAMAELWAEGRTNAAKMENLKSAS